MKKEIAPIMIKGKSIGGKKPLICVPMIGKTEEELIKEAGAIAGLQPDLIEWRVDYFHEVEKMEMVIKVLEKIHSMLHEYPMVFTCRRIEEGGYQEIDECKRSHLIKAVIKTRKVDIVDIELMSGMDTIKGILRQAYSSHVKAIISNHDFNKTPTKEIMIERLIEAQEHGADIAKIAVMPTNERDVLTLLDATLEAKEKHMKIPMITIAMSGRGVLSRIAGGLFGSVVTFAAIKEVSAPGQIPISQLRQAIDILHEPL